MLKRIDPAFAKALAKYLKQQRYLFIKDDKGRYVVEEDVLYQLMKEFRQGFPDDGESYTSFQHDKYIDSLEDDSGMAYDE